MSSLKFWPVVSHLTGQSGKWFRQIAQTKVHTVFRHRVDPLVEGRIKFCHNLLLPVWSYKPEEDL